MSSEKRLLSFELSADGLELEINLNEEGMDDLLLYLGRLKKDPKSGPQHDHWMTPSWAGHELTEERQDPRSILINKVTVTYWP